MNTVSECVDNDEVQMFKEEYDKANKTQRKEMATGLAVENYRLKQEVARLKERYDDLVDDIHVIYRTQTR